MRQGRARDREAGTPEDGLQSIQRLVVGVLGHHHMGHEAGGRNALVDHVRLDRRLHNRLAPGAGPFAADVAHDGERARHVVELLADVLADALHLAAATGASKMEPACGVTARAGIHPTPQQRHVGYVPQHYGLFPHMSALNNVMAGLAHLPPHARAPRAHEWLERMHLTGLQAHRPAELSGGQQQRARTGPGAGHPAAR